LTLIEKPIKLTPKGYCKLDGFDWD